jgi:FAD/FMN-containing dehydrogenase
VRVVQRKEAAYEQARRSTMWNANVPERFPDEVIYASSAEDVIAAVKRAKERGLTVGVRSGGHGWSGNHVRDGGVLLDLSAMTKFSVDKQNMTAIVEPALSGSTLLTKLMKENLFFPVGHCKGVGLGGYLLQGGFGWNGRALGLACESVLAIDYVDADGNLCHASETENAEILWAARGAGPAFFGVIVKFHLRIYSKPAFFGSEYVQYPINRLEEVVHWIDRIGSSVPNSVELQFMISRNPSFPPLLCKFMRGPVVIEMSATVLAESKSAAQSDLEFFQSRPKRARFKLPLAQQPFGLISDGIMQHYPDKTNWQTDNLWTHAGADELLPHLQRVVATMPEAPSHMLWLNWAPNRARKNMAFSKEDRTYLGFYGAWNKSDNGAVSTHWARANVAAMQEFSTGVQFADDPGRDAEGLSDEAKMKLETLRAKHDSAGRFHRWIGDV